MKGWKKEEVDFNSSLMGYLEVNRGSDARGDLQWSEEEVLRVSKDKEILLLLQSSKDFKDK